MNARATVKNLSDFKLGRANRARVHILVYEENHLADTSRFIRAGANTMLDEDLMPGQSTEVDVSIPADQFKGVNMSRAKVVGLFDYLPGGNSGPADLLNAVLGVQAPISNVPTDTPEPPPATDTPEPTPTDAPTSTPRPIVFPTAGPSKTPVPPTAQPVHKGIYLPLLKRAD
jgi:hypothetical protein